MKTLHKYIFILLIILLPVGSTFAQTGIEGIPFILFTGGNAASITDTDYDMMDSLNVDVLHITGVTNNHIPAISSRGMKVIPDQLWMEPDNFIKQYTDAYYTVWEAEGTNPVNGDVSLKYNNSIGMPFTEGNISGIKTKNNAGSGELIYGPGYSQGGQYRFSPIDTADITIYYFADFVLKVEPLTGVVLDTSTIVCTLKVQTRGVGVGWRPLQDTMILGEKWCAKNVEITVGQLIAGQWKTIRLNYDWSQVPDTLHEKLITAGKNVFGSNQKFWAKYAEFIVEFPGSSDFNLYVDKVTVYDLKGEQLATQFQGAYAGISNEASSFFTSNNNTAIYAWYGLDEPYTIDNYEPYRIVDSIVYEATNHAKRIITTLDNSAYGRYGFSQDGSFKYSVTSEFWKRAKPEKIIVNMYPYHYPYTPDENSLYWYYDAEYFIRYKYPAIRDVDPNFGVTLQAFGSNKYENGGITVVSADPNEKQLLYNLNSALLFGAKEIAAYLYYSTYDEKLNYYKEIGLVDKDRQPTNKYFILKNKIVPRLKGLYGQKLKAAGQVEQAAGLNLVNGSQVVQDNHHLDFLSSPTLEIDKKLVIDAGIFKEPGSSMPEYIMLVNRWYSELSELNYSFMNPNSNYRNYRLRDLNSGLTYNLDLSINRNFQSTINKGDGQLLELSPAVKYGGVVQISEVINQNTTLDSNLTITSGDTLYINAVYTVRDTIFVNNGGFVKINHGGAIVFENGGALVYQNWSDCLVINQNTTHPKLIWQNYGGGYQYKIYRKKETPSFTVITTITSDTVTSYTDNGVTINLGAPHSNETAADYYVVVGKAMPKYWAIYDTTNTARVTRVEGNQQEKAASGGEHKITEYNLEQNYPNPRHLKFQL